MLENTTYRPWNISHLSSRNDPVHVFDECDAGRADYFPVIAAFNSEDPGANFPAETLFQLDDDFAGLALGLEFLPGADIDKFRHLVPATLAQGVDSCLRRCGIKKNEL